jgi:hypothetical protein
MTRLYFGGHLWRPAPKPPSKSSPPTDPGHNNQPHSAKPPPQVRKPDDLAGVSTDAALDERILSNIEGGILDVFSDVYCNKHLMYGVLELILVRLMPELAENSITDLWEERLS